MSARVVKVETDDEGGTTTASLASGKRALLVLGHGAGSTREHESLVLLQGALAARDVGSLAFNFPYAEKGKKLPDRMPRLERAYRGALAVARKKKPRLLLAGGRSMGGRVATHLAASEDPAGIEGLVLLGYPLHAAGRPEKLRVEHLPRIRCPMLFVSGTNDELAPLALLDEHVAHLPTAQLQLLHGADHGLDYPKRGPDRARVAEELARSIELWIEESFP